MPEIQNPTLHKMSLMAGGSHYPTINPDMQEAFAKMIINACIDAVDATNLNDMTRTTYDHDMIGGVKQRCIANIKQTFGV